MHRATIKLWRVTLVSVGVLGAAWAQPPGSGWSDRSDGTSGNHSVAAQATVLAQLTGAPTFNGVNASVGNSSAAAAAEGWTHVAHTGGNIPTANGVNATVGNSTPAAALEHYPHVGTGRGERGRAVEKGAAIAVPPGRREELRGPAATPRPPTRREARVAASQRGTRATF
jgi:hypothetical protein